MAAVTEIMADVLKLPRTERSFLAKKLLESLETDEPFSTEELKMFQNRSAEIREGRVKPLTLEQLQQEVSSRMSS
ncbi:MAG: addiction module protein [Luteolibacter sp.]|uniref:addiction module protein n=1 Tax=Luteolibacter sp. TaxID=1962973 RepID=UPI00326564A3